jgi:hypothetical protein
MLSRNSTLRPLLIITTAALLIAALYFTPGVSAQKESTKSKTTVDPRTVGVSFTDGSNLKVLLAEETIDLQTPHGKLTFPITDIVRIEFASRVPEEISLAIDKDIADLGSSDFKVREQAMANLLEKKERSYAALVRASRNQTDQEMRQRIDQLLDKLRQLIPEDQLNIRVHDYVHTAESRIAGKFTATNFKISSAQFGQLQLRLSDIRELRSQGVIADVDADAIKGVQEDPGNMLSHHGDIGKSYTFRVTGNPSGSCYGTDVYTTDTTIATAAVHMGLLKPGETGILIATVLPSPAAFTSTVRNGISSSGWGVYPAAYTLRKARGVPAGGVGAPAPAIRGFAPADPFGGPRAIPAPIPR